MQGRRVGYPRRVDHADPVILLAEPCQHRQQQAELPTTGRIIDKLGDRAHRPAIARQAWSRLVWPVLSVSMRCETCLPRHNSG